MAERAVNIRVSVKDGQKAVAELNKLGIGAEKAMGRVERSSKKAAPALKLVDKSAKSAHHSFQALGSSIAIIDGPLGGISSRFNVLAGAVGRVGLLGAAAVVTMGVLTAGFVSAAKRGAEMESGLHRIDALIKATGGSAGVTAGQLREYGDALALATLTNAKEARKAQGILLSFRNIQNDVYFGALDRAQDLAAVMGTEMSAAALQLGKALNDPIANLSALSRAGVQFSERQKYVIKDLIETGELLEAQIIIMDELERTLGGAAQAEALGMAGAVDTLTDSWGMLLAELGNTEGVRNPVNAFFRTLSDSIESIRMHLSLSGVIDSTVLSLDHEIALLEAKIAQVKALAPPDPADVGFFDKARATTEFAAYQAELDKWESSLARKRQQRAVDQLDEAGASWKAQDRQHEMLLDSIWSRETKLDADILKLKSNRSQKILADEAKDLRAMETLRKQAQGDPAAGIHSDPQAIAQLDRMIVKRKELTQSQLAEVKKATDVKLAANAKVIDGLRFEAAQFGLNDRAQFVNLQLRKLNAKATDEQRAAVAKLAGEIFDQTKAEKEVADAMRDVGKLLSKSESPRDRYIAQKAQINLLLKEEKILQEEATEALRQATVELRRNEEAYRAIDDAAKDAAQSVADFVATSITDIGDLDNYLENLGDRLEKTFADLFIGNPLEEWLDGKMGGEGGWIEWLFRNGGAGAPDAKPGSGEGEGGDAAKGGDQAAKSVVSGFVDGIRKLTDPLTEMLSGFFKNLFSGIFSDSGAFSALFSQLGQMFSSLMAYVPFFHEGGTVGRTATRHQMVPAAAFAGAPRLHGGTMPGLRADEYPAILQRDEEVLSRRQAAALRRGGANDNGPREINVSMSIYGVRDPNEWQDGQGLAVADLRSAIQRAERDA